MLYPWSTEPQRAKFRQTVILQGRTNYIRSSLGSNNNLKLPQIWARHVELRKPNSKEMKCCLQRSIMLLNGNWTRSQMVKHW
ncbi:hypothetical protein KIN20_017022 [Parelaphostrongylus tenuis]|uniref:Uncharacterized protein n=1 Tax=Parelaphostrongylus tenuis TaxID=148309 RepID=A0AAD5MHB9_PARTN|nr:hypothetical protein KIN20_017022 [Parelaphostrongylus tenuis]